jgi:hypothetical protein
MIPGKNISYTEWEFDYAISAKKTVLGFLHRKPPPSDETDEKRRQLDRFRKKVEAPGTVAYWESEDSLKHEIYRAVDNFKKKNPPGGWVRADEAPKTADARSQGEHAEPPVKSTAPPHPFAAPNPQQHQARRKTPAVSRSEEDRRNDTRFVWVCIALVLGFVGLWAFINNLGNMKTPEGAEGAAGSSGASGSSVSIGVSEEDVPLSSGDGNAAAGTEDDGNADDVNADALSSGQGESEAEAGQRRVSGTDGPDAVMPAVGSTVSFGSYEWRVLAVDDETQRALLITQDTIALKMYNETYTRVTWETCTLRTWLNTEFLDGFEVAERNAISPTNVENPNNYIASFGVTGIGGNDTVDMVFLLSVDEAKQYFGGNEDRIATYEGEAVRWWLRSPGSPNGPRAYGVYPEGAIYSRAGQYVNVEDGVRPALWVDCAVLPPSQATTQQGGEYPAPQTG